jgi:predicted nucleic acid-binding protein
MKYNNIIRRSPCFRAWALEDVREVEFYVSKDIIFISKEQIEKSHLEKAKELVSGIDPNDYEYIAYGRHFECKLWSGDGVLSRGLKKKGFKEIISTQELFGLRESLRSRN